MKVSFDFDSTLNKPSVQKYAKYLIAKGVDVWICTSRLSDQEAPNNQWNEDLYAVAEEIGIPKPNIIFCSMNDKYEYLKGFVWHLDDDHIELDLINQHTTTKGISVYGKYKHKCNKLLNDAS